MITTNGQLYQWDIGRIVEVHHLSSSIVSEIHVFNGTTDTALVLNLCEIDGKTVAEIPDELLWYDYNLDIYAVVIDNLGRYTTEHLNTKVLSRPKPADYVYTKKETKTYESLEKRIETLENNGVPDEKIEGVVKEYLEENPIETGATKEQVEQIEQNRNDISQLSSDIADKVTTPKTAEVGQFLVVKEIDNDGKPTMFECITVPSGNEVAY